MIVLIGTQDQAIRLIRVVLDGAVFLVDTKASDLYRPSLAHFVVANVDDVIDLPTQEGILIDVAEVDL